jgi:uncharacterized protein
MRLRPETISKEVTSLRWAMQMLNIDISPKLRLVLSHIQRGLRRTAAELPKTKALPITRGVLMSLCRHVQRKDPATAVALRLAFEAGGRVGDLFNLTPESFLAHGSDGILVLWGVTKTHRTTEARADHQQIIPRASDLQILLRDRGILQRSSSQKVLAALKRLRPSRQYVAHWDALNPTNLVRSTFTLHSLKRGRAAELWTCAAAGSITVTQLMHELKHKSIEAALAYSPMPALSAEAIAKRNAKQ